MDTYTPYRAPLAHLDEVAAEGLEPADRGARLGASLLDGFIAGAALLGPVLAGALALPALMAFPRTGRFPSGIGTVLTGGALAALAILATVVVWNLVWLSRYGQTIGKRLIGIRVLRSDGARASVGRIVGLRWLPMMLLGLVPWVGALLRLVDALLIFRDSRQCLHDQFADTIVVKVP